MHQADADVEGMTLAQLDTKADIVLKEHVLTKLCWAKACLRDEGWWDAVEKIGIKPATVEKPDTQFERNWYGENKLCIALPPWKATADVKRKVALTVINRM